MGCYKMANPPTQLAGKIACPLKVMSQMDISERRVPQDGRIKLKFPRIRRLIFVSTHCQLYLVKNRTAYFGPIISDARH